MPEFIDHRYVVTITQDDSELPVSEHELEVAIYRGVPGIVSEDAVSVEAVSE